MGQELRGIVYGMCEGVCGMGYGMDFQIGLWDWVGAMWDGF